MLPQEQRELLALVRVLARERVAPRAAEIDASHEFPWDVVELFREHGLFGLSSRRRSAAPDRHAARARRDRGGLEGLRDSGADPGRAGARLARAEAGGHDEQKAAWLPRLASGELLGAYALTEAGRAPTRRRCARPRGARATGTCSTVEALHHERRRREPLHGVREDRPEAGHAGISAFLVEADTPGVRGRAARAEDGHHRLHHGRADVRRCRVPAANRLGAEGDGFRLAMRILDRSRPGVAAQALGIAQGATDYALEYAQDARDDGQADRASIS